MNFFNRTGSEEQGMMHEGPLLFAIGATRAFAQGVAEALRVGLAPLEERAFEDGEHKSRPLSNVRDSDVYLLHALDGDATGSVNDKLCRLLFLAATLRDHGAARVTAVCPYLAYARKDRRTRPGDPVTMRYVAALVESMGVDRVVALDVHNPAAYENAFRIPAVHLHARRVLAGTVAAHIGNAAPTVVSPDTGGTKRAEAFRRELETRCGPLPPLAFVEKYRSEGRVTGEGFAGDVERRVGVIVDDLAASGTTLLRAARACRERGAAGVVCVVTHGVFASGALALFEDGVIDRLFVTDSVAPRLCEHWQGRVEQTSVQPLFAQVIAALHQGGPLPDSVAE